MRNPGVDTKTEALLNLVGHQHEETMTLKHGTASLQQSYEGKGVVSEETYVVSLSTVLRWAL